MPPPPPLSSYSPSILPSLASLLPTYTPTTFPPLLLSTADSLLLQSRQRATHLKPDEEIARAYACCEIACTRLRAKLRLPAVKVGMQPCKPGVYKRLIGFLGGVLEEDGQAEERGKRKRDTPGKGVDEKMPVVEDGSATPNRGGRGNTNTFLGKIKTTPQKRNQTTAEPAGPNDNLAPTYTMPRIRTLCRTFRTPLLAPHVYTGVCIILDLSSLWAPRSPTTTTSSDPSEQITGLLIAIYLMTLTLMKKGPKLKVAEYTSTCHKAVEILGYEKGAKGVEEWIRRINRNGWAAGTEWFASVPGKVFEFEPDREDEGEGDGSDEEMVVEEEGGEGERR